MIKGRNDMMSRVNSKKSIILRPRTVISSFDGLSWALQRAVGGAIANIVYGPDRRSEYYKSAVNRENRAILEDLSSQVYSYLNSAITEDDDIREYGFRVWTRVEVDRNTGKILGRPTFEAEIYKKIGEISGKPQEASGYALPVTFVGKKGDHFITPFLIRALKEVQGRIPYIQTAIFSQHAEAPKELRTNLDPEKVYLIIGKQMYVVDTGFDEASKQPYAFICDDKKEIPFQTVEDVSRFLFSKIELEPRIYLSDTIFWEVDKFIESIKDKVSKTGSDEKVNILKELIIEKLIEDLREELEKIDRESLSETHKSVYDKIKQSFDNLIKEFNAKKSLYEAELDIVASLDKDMDRGETPYETIVVQRRKSFRNLRELESDLVTIQVKLKKQIETELRSLKKGIKAQKKEKRDE